MIINLLSPSPLGEGFRERPISLREVRGNGFIFFVIIFAENIKI